MKQTRGCGLHVLSTVTTILVVNVCVVVGVLGGMALFSSLSSPSPLGFFSPTPTPLVFRPGDETFSGAVGMPPLEDKLRSLRDNEDAARSYLTTGAGEAQRQPETRVCRNGSESQNGRRIFWITNRESGGRFEVDAHVVYAGERVSLWAEDGLQFNAATLQEMGRVFDEQIYPTTLDLFGGEEGSVPLRGAQPFVHVLYARNLGSTTAGYFSQSLELMHGGGECIVSMIFLNADQVRLDDDYAYSVLAHEFGHLVHRLVDADEETWLDEGIAELSAYRNGFDVGSFAQEYLKIADVQLNTWESNKATPHYGAAFLFVDYFLERFGIQALQALTLHPADGIASLDAVLDELGGKDRQTQQPLKAEDVFGDWAIANLVNDADLYAGEYAYADFSGLTPPHFAERISHCAQRTLTRDVHQFGVDYVEIACPGEVHLRFEGSLQTALFPLYAHSGESLVWAGGGSSPATLTRRFDFSDTNSPLTLTYWTWFDLQRGRSFVSLLISSDGENWQVLSVPSGGAVNMAGNRGGRDPYAWGYTGLSSRGAVWIQEKVDLSAFAGRSVYLRFAAFFDATDGEGTFLLDDVAIAENGYAADFEADGEGWQPVGFRRVGGAIPQHFRLALVTYGAPTRIEKFQLPADNSMETTLRFTQEAQRAVLVISGTSRFTRQPAAYRLILIDK